MKRHTQTTRALIVFSLVLAAIVVWMAGVGSNGPAYGTSAGASAESASEEQAEVEATIGKFWAAIAEQDRERFRALCDDRWLLFTARGNRFDVDRLFDMHEANIRDFAIDMSNMHIEIDDRFAWATYDAVFSGTAEGESWGGDFLITKIFEKDGDEWICRHMHESREGS